VGEDPALVAAETALYHSRRENLEKTVSGLREALSLVNRELQLTSSLVSRGAASNVEVLRLKRQANELNNKLSDAENQYIVRAREELAKANAEAASQRSIIIGRADTLKRTVVVAPVRGIVKDIEVNTVGGVIPQRGNLMEIVPLDEQLIIEAQIAPRDVAFITPGQRAVVKLTAYDFNIYGGLEGEVASISPDTIQDEVHRDQYFYRVYIRTDKDYLVNKKGKHFPVYPGMIAMGEIHTGSKTIIEYLLKQSRNAEIPHRVGGGGEKPDRDVPGPITRRLSRQQTGSLIIGYQRIKQRNVGTAAGQQLCPGHGGKNGPRPCLTLLHVGHAGFLQSRSQPGNIHLRKMLHLGLHRLGKIVIFCGHKAAHTEPVFAFQRTAENMRILAQTGRCIRV